MVFSTRHFMHAFYTNLIWKNAANFFWIIMTSRQCDPQTKPRLYNITKSNFDVYHCSNSTKHTFARLYWAVPLFRQIDLHLCNVINWLLNVNYNPLHIAFKMYITEVHWIRRISLSIFRKKRSSCKFMNVFSL